MVYHRSAVALFWGYYCVSLSYLVTEGLFYELYCIIKKIQLYCLFFSKKSFYSRHIIFKKLTMLSKSDFKIASSCPKKLIYKKASYKTKNDENEYMEMLAKGGHIVSKYAQLMYPGAIEVNAESLEQAFEKTRQLLEQNENITLFEATFLSNGKVVRTDILEKKGNVLDIIEVKSKSHDDEEDRSKTIKNLQENIEDVAYQTLVVKELYPEYEIHSYLLLPDKAKRTTIEGLAGWFSASEMVDEKFEMDELPARNGGSLQRPLIKFKYENDANRLSFVNQLKDDYLLSMFNVDNEVNTLLGLISERTLSFQDILQNGIQPEHFSINKNCSKCEFNLGSEQEKNGFRDCWQDLADTSPNIFDLHHGGSIKGYLDELITNKRVSFWDLDVERFRRADGEYGPRGERQLLQFNQTRENKEYIHPSLKGALESLVYPLHFIDFETYSGAVPHHKGMRAYEKVAFQWSCHTIERPGGDPIHSEFLNDEYDFPNFRFAKALMNQIGETGTPLMWSSFENTILKDVLKQMEAYNYKDDVLKNWLINITKDKGREGRFVDLNDFTLKYYFHPDMKGKTSIKKVLPAIWNNNEYLHSNPWFSKYVSESGSNANPYDNLEPIYNALENEEVVQDGTGAMRFYHEYMFGTDPNDHARKAQLRKILLQYCELDTMAMVIIWRYWMDRI